jgi:hypothetical protein
MIGREIERDAGAEGDRHPRHQPTGAGFRCDPFAQFCGERRPRAETRRRQSTGLRCARLRPGADIAAAAFGPAPLHHPLKPRLRNQRSHQGQDAIVRFWQAEGDYILETTGREMYDSDAEGVAPQAGAPENIVRSLPQEALIDAAFEIQLVTGCYVSQEDYAASVAVLLRELAKDGYEISRHAVHVRPEDKRVHHLSIEIRFHALLGGRHLPGKI